MNVIKLFMYLSLSTFIITSWGVVEGKEVKKVKELVGILSKETNNTLQVLDQPVEGDSLRLKKVRIKISPYVSFGISDRIGLKINPYVELHLTEKEES